MRYFKTLAVILTIAVLAGCSGLPAHNNTLIFAVKREVGVGVHTPGASTDPGIYLGYSSREIAWVPLWANGREGAMPCGTVNSTTATATHTTGTNVGGTSYQNSDCLKGPKFVGDGDSKRDPHDAYSTFASFGGNLNGSTDVATGQTKADAKLASFFATGIAAQNLSKAMGLVNPVFIDEEKEKKEKANEKVSPDSQTRIAGFLEVMSTAAPKSSSTASLEACISKMALDATVSVDETSKKDVANASGKTISKSIYEMKNGEKKLTDNDFDSLANAADLLKRRFEVGIKKKGTDAEFEQMKLVCDMKIS